MHPITSLFVVLLFIESLSEICDNTIFCETFESDLSSWKLDNFTKNPIKIVTDKPSDICPDRSCLKIVGNGGNIAKLRYAETVINMKSDYEGLRIKFDMYVGDIEIDGETNQIGTEYAGLQYSLDDGNTYIDGNIIKAIDVDDTGEKQLYSDLTVTIRNISDIKSINIRLMAFISSKRDEIFYDNIRVFSLPLVFGTKEPTLSSKDPTKTPTMEPFLYPTMVPSQKPVIPSETTQSPKNGLSKTSIIILISIGSTTCLLILCCLVLYLLRYRIYTKQNKDMNPYLIN